MGDLQALLINEIRKPLEHLEMNRVGHIEAETTGRLYYKIDDRSFAVEVREVEDIKKELEERPLDE